MRFPPLLSVAVSCLVVLPASGAEPRGDRPDAPALSPAEQLTRFKVPPGFEVQLVAAEPEIQKPININFDAAGRLWVTGSELYPWPAATDALGNPLPDFAKVYEDMANAFGSRGKAPEIQLTGRDTVRILSDFDATGRAAKVEVFADKLNIPTGIQPLPRKPGAKGDTAIVYSIPNIWRFEDTDGDGKADKREPLYEGFGFLDTHGMSSNYIYWLDGWIYGCHGFRNRSEVKDRNGKVTVFESGNTYRFKPDGSKIEYFTHGQTNPFGLAFDPHGNLYSADSHSKPIYMLIRGGYYEGIRKQHDGLGFAPRITDDNHGSSAIAGILYYADDKWPAEFHGNLFNGNPVTNRVNRAKLDWNGSTPKATRLEDFVVCDDPWFRPVQVKLGPDGAMYIADFYNPIIGHYEVPLNDPRRDRKHGRIWRVVWKGNQDSATASLATSGISSPPSPSEKGISQSGAARHLPEPRALPMPDLSRMDATGLVNALGEPNLEVRRLATNEMVDRIAEKATNAFEKQKGDSSEYFAVLGTDRIRSLTQGESLDRAVHSLWILARLHALDDVLHRLGEDEFAPVGFYIHAARALAERNVPREELVRYIVQKGPIYIPPPGAVAADFVGVNSAVLKGAPIMQRAAAEQLGFTDTPRSIDYLTEALQRVSPKDLQLRYTLQLSLKNQLSLPGYYQYAAAVLARSPEESEILADVSLALSTEESATFLLEHLRRTNFQPKRSAEYLRHAALHLPVGQLSKLVDAVTGGTNGTTERSGLPLSTRLSIADALGEAARKRGVTLPESANSWVHTTMMEALEAPDAALLDRAIAAVRDEIIEAKAAPLKKLIFKEGTHGPRRAAALEALMNLPAGIETAAAALADTSSLTLRKKAAELLAQEAAAKEATDTLLAALPTAPGELAVTIAAGLAKTDAGAGQLLSLVEAGRVSAALLRSKGVEGPLAQRSDVLKKRAAELTAGLPPEDVRLNRLIAKRAEEFRTGKRDPVRGQQLFEQQCAACHKLRNAGGNVGPNLDGIASRGVHRVMEDILDPNRNVDPAFRQTLIETTDGRLVAGVNVRTDGDLVLLTDAAGQEQRLSKSAVREQRHSPLSLMPATFEQTLPGKDLLDLVGYLVAPPEQN